MNRRDYWLHVVSYSLRIKLHPLIKLSSHTHHCYLINCVQGIIVKILNKKLGDKIHKKKGVIEELHDQYTATVRMLDTREKLKLDQSDLESVIPAIG